MRATRRSVLLYFLVLGLPALSTSAVAQQLIDWVLVGIQPGPVVFNPVTNKAYVANEFSSTVTVIDNADNTVTVPVGFLPIAITVNSVTNKVYTANGYSQNVTVIDAGNNNQTTNVPVGSFPWAVAVNSVTNKIYVSNLMSQSVSVIDGTTNSVIATVLVGSSPYSLAVNSVTNKIYVANFGANTVSVIDGSTNTVSATVTVGNGPRPVVVNPKNNKIYVTNWGSNSLSVIDGTTLSVTTVNLPGQPSWLAVNPTTNKIYVASGGPSNYSLWVIDGGTFSIIPLSLEALANALAINSTTNTIYVAEQNNTLTAVNGATNSTSTINVGSSPDGEAVDEASNRIYVTNFVAGYVSVVSGAPYPLQFVAVIPCRLIDTRQRGGPIQGGTSRSFIVPQLGGCNIPTSAKAYSLNVTVVTPFHGTLGYLTLWPTGENQPVVSLMNSLDGRIKANAAVVSFGEGSAVNVFVTDTTNVVLDINGYFAAASQSTLAFYPLPPCRVADTRNKPGDLGGPYLKGGQPRDFPVLEATACNIPPSAQAYSLNLTAVPYPKLGYPLGYLEVWPTGQKPQNPVSTLNNLTGTIVANAAIVPAGTGGKITLYPSADTHALIDIAGYFAPAGQGGLSLYPTAPCRVIDTRKIGDGQPFSGLLNPPVDVVDSTCGVPSTAQAYVFNATVVPSPYLGYLTLWPDSEQQPVVSTLNAIDGAITSNMAIVPNIDGKTNAFASGITQLILDISSYFAP